MSRVYATKGADAKTDRLTIPVTAALHQRVVAVAQAAGLDKTRLAREAIEVDVRRREQEVEQGERREQEIEQGERA